MSVARRCAVSVLALLALACATVTPDRGRPPGSAAKPFTFSILEDYDKGQDLAAIDRDFSLFHELGVTTWRGSFGWDDYEPEPGRYDFAWLHQFIQLAARRGITLRPYVAFTPEWAAGGDDRDTQAWNQPPRDQRRWSAFVEALARELAHHPNVRSLEIYNEQNVEQWWEGSRAEYAATLRAAARALRRHAPSLDLLAGGLVFPDLDWVEEVCGTAGTARAFDVLPIHAYPETWTPPHVTVENYLGEDFAERFAAAVDRACGPKRIWINETGFATVPGRSERDQAAWWARAITTFAADPRVEHVGIYEIRDLAADKPAIGDAPNYHLGLLRNDGTKKLAFATVDLLTDLLDAGSVTLTSAGVTVDAGGDADDLYQHVFTRPDGSRLFVIWNRTAAARVAVSANAALVTEYALDGTALPSRPAFEAPLVLEPGVPRIFVLR